MGYVYKITNTVNQKSYVGISINEPTGGRINKHLSGHGNRIIANAVKKYGKDVFTYEVLEANVFDEFLPDLEVAYIANFNTVTPNGYNLTYGGEKNKKPSTETRRKISKARKGKFKGKNHPNFGKTPSEDTRRKMSEALTGKKHSEDTRRKMSEARKGENNPNFGKTHPTETRRKISKANKGKTRSAEMRRKMSETRKNPCAETRRKISEAGKGRKHSAETRRKISEANKGKVRSAEMRRKMSEANKHPDHNTARNFFFSLPSLLSLKEKRKRLFHKFTEVSKKNIYKWVKKWHQEQNDQ